MVCQLMEGGGEREGEQGVSRYFGSSYCVCCFYAYDKEVLDTRILDFDIGLHKLRFLLVSAMN